MCGRFTLTADVHDLQMAFPWAEVPEQHVARYNIAPSQPVAVIASGQPNKVDFFNWGLIPSWAKDPTIGNRMINARAETIIEKPSFRNAFQRRRCLVLADGFFEWKKAGNTKTPMFIRLKSGKPFAFAGLWEIWRSPDGSEIKSCTIITTEPNELMSDIHNRMPVILSPDSYTQWLDSSLRDPRQFLPLLRSYPADDMQAFPVSRLVNNPASDQPECILPATAL